MKSYVIQNTRTGKYWNAGVCDRDNILEAKTFVNSERCYIHLSQNEKWIKSHIEKASS